VKKGIAVLVYVVFVTLTLELVSRVLFSVEPLRDAIVGPSYDDSSWRLRWISRHVNGDLLDGIARYDSTKGWSFKPNLKTTVGAKSFSTNSKSMRATAEYSYEKPLNKVRILMMGDSFTAGDEVADDETSSNYLQEMLPESEVINFGCNAYGHDQMLIWFQEEGRRYSPDIVVLGFVSDDMRRNMVSFRDYSKPRFTLEGNSLVLTNAKVDRPEYFIASEFYRSKFHDLLVILYNRIMWKWGSHSESMVALTSAILDEIVRSCRQIGARPVFAYLPTNRELEDIESKMLRWEEYLYEYCKERHVDYVTTRPLFLEESKRGHRFETWGHWGADGHRLVALAVGRYLLENENLRPGIIR
jgi:hypothetical protein